MKRWEINATYRGSLRKCFDNHIIYHPQKFKDPDLNLSRIKKDEDAVQKISSAIEATFVDPLSPLPLISISTGIIATDKVTSDMMSAKAIGKEAIECKQNCKYF